MMIAEIKSTTEGKMDQSIAAFKNNLTKIRTAGPIPPCSITCRWTTTAR